MFRGVDSGTRGGARGAAGAERGVTAGAMPARLEQWLWRTRRIRAGRTELTRLDAAAALRALQADRTAFPDSYLGFETELAEVVETLEVLTQHRSRREDLVSIVAAEQRASRRSAETDGDEPAESDRNRHRRRAAAELDRVPAGLPPELDGWARRVIRHQHELVPIDPEYAARAETVLRSDARAYPDAYASGWVQARLREVLRQLGEIATRQRPGEYSRAVRGID